MRAFTCSEGFIVRTLIFGSIPITVMLKKLWKTQLGYNNLRQSGGGIILGSDYSRSTSERSITSARFEKNCSKDISWVEAIDLSAIFWQDLKGCILSTCDGVFWMEKWWNRIARCPGRLTT